MCVDPCAGFKECGTNAVCSSIHHLPVCTCPPGFKELNSPYDACVEESIDLTQLECLTDSDCASGACFRGSCRSPQLLVTTSVVPASVQWTQHNFCWIGV